MSLQGESTKMGLPLGCGAKFAVKKINEAGGVQLDGQRYRLEQVFYDDKSNPTESSRLVEKLIADDGVDFLLGPYSSGITIPASIVAQRYRMPMIEGGGASSKIFTRGNAYIFGTLPRAEDYFASTLEFLKTQKPLAKKIAIVYADDKFDLSVGEGTRARAPGLGFEVAIFEKYAEGASDFSSILTKIKSAGIEAVLVAGHTGESINFVTQAKELNVSPYYLGLTVGPTEADYVYGVASWSPQMQFNGYLFKDTQSFVKEFEQEFAYDPDYHNASAVAGIAVFKDAVERTGSLDRQKVRDAIAATDLATIYGRVQFLDNGQIKGTSVVLQNLNGKISQVYPSLGSKAVYPIPPWDKR